MFVHVLFVFPALFSQLFSGVTSDRLEIGVSKNEDVECISSHLSSFVFHGISGPVHFGSRAMFLSLKLWPNRAWKT